MAEYRLEFSADSLGAENSIKRLRAEIRKVTDAFEKAEIGSDDFIKAASDLSGLNQGLKTARNAVVDLEKAYKDLGRAVDDMQKIHDRALKAGEKHHRSILDLAEESFKREDSIRDKNYKAELDDWNRRLDAAVAARKKIDAQQKAIMEFRAGMGARGAIPGIASPIQGGADIKGSPLYLQPESLGRMEERLNELQAEARRIAPDTKEWNNLNKEILKAERGIQNIQKRQRLGPTGGQRLGAAGGAFLYGGGLGGGVGSALGGIAGGLMGGVPGAFTGAAIGQLADNLGTALAGITSQAAAVMQMQRGLAMASVDAKDFAEAQSTVASMSERLLMPLEQTTRLFTQLRVNTKQYNLSVQDTAKIMEGTALAIMATGGSSEDLEGAMRAVVQIMSKGGVQAEELRGQLGERFPGAVVKFAQANKLSFEELQKGLEDGRIGIKEFVAFAEKNYTDYAEFSKQLATAPEFAGKRLQIALEQLGREVGGLFAPIGAEIQDTLTSAIKGIANFVKENRVYLKQHIADWASIIGPIAKIILQLFGVIAKFTIEVNKLFQGLFSQIRRAVGMATIGEAKARLDAARKATAGKEKPKGNVRGGGAWTELSQAEQQFKDLGGEAAWKKFNAPLAPSNLTFGGVGAGMPLERTAKDTEEREKKTNLEAFERLRDQLANAYNQAEIERIKARYELEKRLRDDLYDRQEFGANRLQRQALGFLRALMKAEDDRAEAVMQARLDVMEKSGSVVGGAGGTGAIAGGATGSMSIVEFGKALQKMGFTVKEHPAFGGVGKHSRGSYHYSGEALDITDWRGGDWKGRTKGLGEMLRKSGAATEVFHPGYDPVGGHKTHVHAAFKGGRVPLTAGMQQFLGGQIGAGVPRKVGSNESRDTMAGVNVELAKAKALETERGQEMLKNSTVMKEVARYAQEAYGLPDLELDNRRLAERNRLVAEGLDENTINYRMRLLDVEEQHSFLQKEMEKELKKLNLTEAQRKDILDVLTEEMNKATAAEKKKNDETLRGLFIQKTLEQDRRLALAQAISPDEELRVRLQQENPRASAFQIEELFQKEKIIAQAEALKQQLNSIASSISDAFANAFKGMITGSMTVTEALSGMFKSIADSFADMAAKMIADWIKMQILGIFKSILSFLGPKGGFSFGGKSGGFNLPGFKMPDYMSGASIPTGKFANGGIVQGPTLGLVGEGRYNEAIVPLPDGRSIPVQMQGGSSRDLLASSGAQSSAPPVLSMNFQSTTINGVEYVDRAQLEAAMQETRKLASRDGASRGASLALDRLQNSPSTRRRVGIR